jgi:palmitoyltransferase
MGGRKDIFGTRLGTSFEARRWLSLDTCGFIGISMSFSVHLFAFGVVVSHLLKGSLPATAVFLLLYTPSVTLALASLFMAWTTDPGAVPMGARPLVTVRRASSGEIVQNDVRRNRALRRCHKCNDNFKPARAHHDSVTGRCIVKFDHFW